MCQKVPQEAEDPERFFASVAGHRPLHIRVEKQVSLENAPMLTEEITRMKILPSPSSYPLNEEGTESGIFDGRFREQVREPFHLAPRLLPKESVVRWHENPWLHRHGT